MALVRFSPAAIVRVAGRLREAQLQPNMTTIAAVIGMRPATLSKILRREMPELERSAKIVSYPGCDGARLHQLNLVMYLKAVQSIHARNDVPTYASLARELGKSKTTVQSFCYTHRNKVKDLFTVYSEFEARVFRVGRSRLLRNVSTTRTGLLGELRCSRMALYKVLKRHPLFVFVLGLQYKGRWATRTDDNPLHPVLGLRRNIGECTRLTRAQSGTQGLDMPERIMRSVAARYGVPLKDLRSPEKSRRGHKSRTKLLSKVAIYLIREETDASFAEIGNMFNVSRQAATNSHAAIKVIARSLKTEFAYIRNLCGIYD